jgi:RNA polymerase sigma factor for flagellar operon FliA
MVIKQGLGMPGLRSHRSPTPPWRDWRAAALPARQQVRDALFFDHQDLAEAMSQKYIRLTPAHKVDPEDLRMAAYEGLLYAIDHFDPAQMEGAGPLEEGFRRYASRCIFGYLMSEMISHDPLNRHLVEQVREYRQQADRLAQFLGRGPTAEELREALGCRDEQRFQLLEALADYPVNQESLAPEPDGEGVDGEVEDWNVTQAAAHAVGRCPLASNPPYEATVLALFREQLREAVGQLPPLEQQLIQVHYYQEESLSQMARDIGLSRQTLSKYHQQALARLEETLRRRGLTEEAWPDRWEVNFY